MDHMIRYICKASFALFSLQNFAQIRIQIVNLMQKVHVAENIRFRAIIRLKVPKREIFVTELFIQSDPIWVGDLRTEPKKPLV